MAGVAAVSSMTCSNTQRTDQASMSLGNHGSSGTGTGSPRSAMPAIAASVYVATSSYAASSDSSVSSGVSWNSAPYSSTDPVRGLRRMASVHPRSTA